MTILVFGSTGQVGRELARSNGVVALDRTQADLTDPAACADQIRQIQPVCVINAAAYTAVEKAQDEPDLAQVINGDAPGAMAVICAEMGIPFLHISTDYVFDGTGKNFWLPTDIANPIGVYGRSKLVGEELVAAADGAHAILRTSWVFSAHGANFVKTMLRLGADCKSINVVADQVGGPTAAGDIAATLLQMADLLMTGSGASGVYHFSGQPNISWAGFARAVFDQAGMNARVEEIRADQYPTRAFRPVNSRLDCSDLLRDYSIAQPDWRTSLAKVLVELG